MPDPRDPLELDDGVENIPVVKVPVQAVKQAGTTAVKHTAAQAKAITKAFVSQLYGVTDPASDTTADASADPSAQQNQQAAPAAVRQQPQQQQQQSMQPPKSEEQKLAEARKRLHDEYVMQTLGGDLEAQIKKEEQKREQAKQQEEQEEEQKKVQMEELKEEKKKETPVAVQIARSKSERRPGAG